MELGPKGVKTRESCGSKQMLAPFILYFIRFTQAHTPTRAVFPAVSLSPRRVSGIC